MPTHDPYSSLRFPDFRWLVIAYWALMIATQIQAVVVGWQVYEQTKDPLALGLVGLAEALPFIGMALYAGHVVDRAARRPIAIFGIVVMLLCAIALLGFSMTPGIITPQRVWPIYAVIFVTGIARAFIRPALTVMSAEVVPRELHANAVAWRTSTWQFAAVVGPAAGGLLYGFAGARTAYSVDVVLIVVSLASLAFVRHKQRPIATEEMPVAESLKIGIRFVFREPVLLASMTLDLFAVLFGGATALLPIFAKMLEAGPQGLGILRAGPAVGSVVCGLYMAHRPPLRRAGPTLLICVAIFGGTMIGFALSPWFWMSFALLTIGGAADQVSVIIRSTLVQIVTPPHMLGRVSAVNSVFIGSSNEIGAFESGVAAKLLGVVPSVVFGGFMTLTVVALTAFWSRPLRQLREIHPA